MAIPVEFVPLADAKAFTGIGRSSLYSLFGRGEICAIKAGRRTLYDVASLREWLASRPAAVIRPPLMARMAGAVH
jgi:predicted DNA-binding transcriptional regulator AlpA